MSIISFYSWVSEKNIGDGGMMFRQGILCLPVSCSHFCSLSIVWFRAASCATLLFPSFQDMATNNRNHAAWTNKLEPPSKNSGMSNDRNILSHPEFYTDRWDARNGCNAWSSFASTVAWELPGCGHDSLALRRFRFCPGCVHEGLLTFAVHDEGCKQWPGSGTGHRQRVQLFLIHWSIQEDDDLEKTVCIDVYTWIYIYIYIYLPGPTDMNTSNII